MCDTFVFHRGTSQPVIFGKNSDREPNEAQQIVRIPRNTSSGKKVRATFMEVDHPGFTHEIILSKPFQMWGVEMGCNEFGVVIGNEAVFTKVGFDKSNNGLTGMDLLRLALEISETAEDALKNIISYLEKYGQDACGGYRDKKFFYHNSFIISDNKEAYVLETAGRHWVYQKVNGYRAISNGLTIEEKYDGISSNAETFARKKGWIKKSEAFNFRKAFSSWLMPKLAASIERRNFTESECRIHGRLYVEDAFKILRSHSSKNAFEPCNAKTDSVCMHASGMLTPHQTVGSMVVELRENMPPTVWLTGTAAPCLSIFKPFYFGNDVLDEQNFSSPSAIADNSYWWKWDQLHRTALHNYPGSRNIIDDERNRLEEEAMLQDKHLNKKFYTSETSKAVSMDILEQSIVLREKWLAQITQQSSNKHFWYDRFWKKQNRKADMENTNLQPA